MNRTKPEPIRVLHFAPSLDQGGLEKLQIEFARYADRSRFSLRFLALAHGGRAVDELKNFDWPVDVLNKQSGLKPFKVFELARLFRRWRVEVLHTHNNGPLIYGAPGARLAGVPVIVHTRHHGRDHVVNRRETALSTAVSRLVDRVICVSEDSLTQGRIDGIDPKSLRTIWNGIDLSRFDYLGPQERGPAVCVARLTVEKNIETLLAAVDIIRREAPDYRLEIAGDGGAEQGLKSLAAELGLGEHVTFLGNVKDVPALLSRSSVMVLPSLTEGISLTLLEAMARGLPVVTTRVGGNPEVVVDGVTGLLVPPRAPEDLARALLRLWRSPQEAKQMGLAGRDRVERHFDVRRMVADYEDLYLEILRKKRGDREAARIGALSAREEQGPIEPTRELLAQSFR